MSNLTRTTLFILTLAIFGCGFCASLTSAVRIQSAKAKLPSFENDPLVVRPLYNDARVVGDSQLHRVLIKLRPPAIAEFPKVNHIDHALRFWGLEARFPNSDHPDGFAMRDFLIDDTFFRDAAKSSNQRVQPLMKNQGTGVWFRTQEGRDTSSHVDHTLSTLAEAGTELSCPIKTPAGERRLRAAMEHALRSFSIDQPEYEWTAITFALYQVDDAAWQSPDGFEITWDRIAKRLLRQRMGQGSCYGGHRLYTLTAILRIHEDHHPMLSDDVRAHVVDHLTEATGRLVANQSTDGWMDGTWTGEVINRKDKLPALGARLLSTGHALEWWAIAPESLQPPREVVVRAGNWLSKTILQMDDGLIRSNYTFLTHAGRALVLWRGVFPAEFETQFANRDQQNQIRTGRRINHAVR